MFKHLEISGRRGILRLVSLGLLAGVSAGCSADLERFSEPLVTGSTANQRSIIQNGSYSDGKTLPPRSSNPVPVVYAPPGNANPTQSLARNDTYDRITTASISRQPTPVYSKPLPLPAMKPRLPTVSRNVVPTVSNDLVTGSITQPQTTYIRPKNTPLPPVQSVEVARPVVDPAYRVASSNGGWGKAGGTYVQLQQGETIYSTSRRYGVPVSAILKANNLVDASQAKVGQQLLIPTYVHSANAPVSSPDAELKRVASNLGQDRSWDNVPVPKVNPYRVLNSRTVASSYPQTTTPVRTNPASLVAPLTTASIPVTQSLPRVVPVPRRAPYRPVQTVARVEQPEIVTGSVRRDPYNRQVNVALVPSPKRRPQYVAQVRQIVQETKKPEVVVPTRTASLDPTIGTKPSVTERVAEKPKPQTTASTNQVRFRWPANGRIISNYGVKADGQRNDGINLSVPMNTSVKAAEDGTVIYSGNELKGYGNLVLVRHPNGWVSAYAHNSSLKVKRGQPVRRGQIIAKSGQSGSVTSPQLHFELRKGSNPIDPLPYLSGT